MVREIITEEDRTLLAALGVEEKTSKTTRYTAPEEWIIAGFEEIQHYVEAHGRAPQRWRRQ